MNIRANLLLLFALGISLPALADTPKFIGVTRASHDVQLALPVEGLVTRIEVEEGQRVEAGQSLLHLDNQLQASEARRRELIKDDTAQIRTLEHNLKIVKSLLEASRQLFGETGSISEEEVKKLEMQYVTMDGEYQSLLMQKKRETVEYQAALEDLKRRTLSAPRAGIVSEILVETGEWATPQQAVVRLVDPQQCHLELQVEERFARHFSPGADIPVLIGSVGDEREIAGRVDFVSPVADQASGLVRVKIGFDNRAAEIWPGMPAAVALPQQTAAPAAPASDTLSVIEGAIDDAIETPTSATSAQPALAAGEGHAR